MQKQKQLFNKYFGNLVYEAAIERPETIGEYTKDLPLKIEAEYRNFLEELWRNHTPGGMKGVPFVLEEQNLRKLMTDDELHREVQGLVKDVRQVIDNYRDTTPISTFGSLIMGGL